MKLHKTLVGTLRSRCGWGALGLMLVVGAMLVACGESNSSHKSAMAGDRNGADSSNPPSAQAVQTTRPTPGGLQRTSAQPGSLVAFESAALFAKVSGYLINQRVDIGDKVKPGQTLAEIDDPELGIEVQQSTASLTEAKSQVDQMSARVTTATAKWQASIAAETQSEAEVARATAQRVFREKQYERIKHLFDLNSIDERLVDEKQDEMEAARGAERASKAAIDTAKADVAAAAAMIEEAKANLKNAQAKVQVAQAILDRATVVAGYRTITSPYQGVITKRNFNRGDFVRDAQRTGEAPLLLVERTDLLRCVVQVPDLDVPWAKPGCPASVEIDALPGETFTATVSRTAEVEDTLTRTMRVEIDLTNPTGKLQAGMFGRVTIQLLKNPNAMVVPLSCLVGSIKEGKAVVYVMRNGKEHLVQIKIGGDNGSLVEILQGLSATDDVVSNPNANLADGAAVTANESKP